MNSQNSLAYNADKTRVVAKSFLLLSCTFLSQAENINIDHNMHERLAFDTGLLTTYQANHGLGSLNSSLKSSFIKNDTIMVKSMDQYFLLKDIEERYNTKVIQSWTPAEGENRKVCLFVKLEKQDELSKKYEKLELDMYLFLREKLMKNKYYDAVALI